ncbi:MAG: FtsX-like permease family protein [Gammaproteobacteria bacterium]|jgi:putative ABC transport system permease protein|nr:FtsX-like permease family protein [Gammaproteobacteria bacterium]
MLSAALINASRRYLSRHRWQTWLSIAGIALGVAVVIAVDLANESAKRGFRLSVEQVTGTATHQIVAASGSIPEQLYATLRLEQRLDAASPAIDAPVRIAGRSFTLLGLDPLAAAPLRPDLGPGLIVASETDDAATGTATTGTAAADATRATDAGMGASTAARGLLRLLRDPATFALSADDADALGLAPGDRVEVDLGTDRTRMTLVALIPAQAGLSGLALTDIATAQEVLGRLGEIERIDLILTEAEAGRVAAALPPGVRLEPAAQRTNALAQMTRAFHTNLTAMSLLAMLVGAFIVYNTMTFAVLQRRPLLGTLRMLGTTRSQLFALILTETLALAAIGALLGVLLGIAVGAGLVQLVTRTINDIYFQLNVRELHLDPGSLAKGIGLGLGVTLLAALGPALEAARSQPRDVIRRTRVEGQTRRLLPWLASAGVLLIIVGMGLIALSARSMGIGFLALFLVIVGTALLMPLGVHGFATLTIPLFGRLFGIQGRLAARGITASITRSGLAVAALAVAVSATMGVSIMIGSFRTSVSDWLANTLTSDIYISSEASGSAGRSQTLPPELADDLLALPEVTAVSQGRRNRVQTRSGPTHVLALESSTGQPRGFDFAGPTADDLWPRWHAGELVLISQPYAYRQQLAVGDRIELFTTDGWQGFEIGGVFQDYGSDSGTLILPRPVYAERWDDPALSSFGLVLTEAADSDAVRQRVDALLGARDIAASVQTNRAIRELSLTIFDQTFTITKVLRLLAIGVAFIGILSALMALELERARDYAVLRATGMTRGQLRALILIQTSAMGLAAGLLAIPLGLTMGDLLISVINLRSFGWTMPMQVEAQTLVSGVLLAWIAAVLAGLYPAIRAARAVPAQALREE